jgi:DNA-binding IclR family transcriptional regulator
MSTRPLPAEVHRFVLTSIPSVPYLEAVLLLRAQPALSWNAARLARRLYIPEPSAAELLQQLTAAGVAAQHAEEVRYTPATAELAELLDALAHQYSINLVAVTDLIHSRTGKRAQQFADAFRWRKDN